MSGRTRAVLRAERLEAREVPTAAPIFAVGAGPGGGPRVQVFDGQRLTAAGTAFTGAAPFDVIADFFAYDPNSRGGVRVAVAPSPTLGLSPANLVTAPGPGIAPEIRVFNGLTISA